MKKILSRAEALTLRAVATAKAADDAQQTADAHYGGPFTRNDITWQGFEDVARGLRMAERRRAEAAANAILRDAGFRSAHITTKERW